MVNNMDVVISILRNLQTQYQNMMTAYPTKKLQEAIESRRTDLKGQFKHRLQKLLTEINGKIEQYEQGWAVTFEPELNELLLLNHGFINQTLYPPATESRRSSLTAGLLTLKTFRQLYTQHVLPVVSATINAICRAAETDILHAKEVLLYLGRDDLASQPYRYHVMDKGKLAENFQQIENSMRTIKTELETSMRAFHSRPAPSHSCHDMSHEQQYQEVMRSLTCI